MKIFLFFAEFFGAFCVCFIFLICLTELVRTNSIPKTILHGVWWGASSMIRISIFGAECFRTMGKCWIFMANIDVTIFRKSIFTRLFIHCILVPATWWSWIGITPRLDTMNVCLSCRRLTEFIVAIFFIPCALISFWSCGTPIFALVILMSTECS